MSRIRIGRGRIIWRLGRTSASSVEPSLALPQSLALADPTLTDPAEIMLCSGDPELVGACLPHVTRKRDDPWRSSALTRAKPPDGPKFILERGVDPSAADDASR